MQIDRSNYEIWLIDWIDGNLNDIEVAQLKCFLNANTDLKAEFDELNTLKDPIPFIPKESFLHKEKLRKTSADLSGAQFEYLCAAYLENDLSDDQKSELLQSITQDSEKRRSFELIQKLKLTPPDISFKRKNRLIRRTVGQKTLRLALIGLSAAAIISMVIMNRISIPRSLPVKADITTLEIGINNPLLNPSIQKSSDKLIPVKNSSINKTQAGKLTLISQIGSPVLPNISTLKPVQKDTLALSSENPMVTPTRIAVSEYLNLWR